MEIKGAEFASLAFDQWDRRPMPVTKLFHAPVQNRHHACAGHELTEVEELNPLLNFHPVRFTSSAPRGRLSPLVPCFWPQIYSFSQ